MDSAGAHITTVGGALTFYSLAHYTDSVITPEGMKPAACVQEIPNGAFVTLNGLVRWRGAIHLLLPCSLGTYVVTLVREVRYPHHLALTGLPVLPAHVGHPVLLAGTFLQTEDTLTLVRALTLVDTLVAVRLSTTTSDSTIMVTSPSHQYRFEIPWQD